MRDSASSPSHVRLGRHVFCYARNVCAALGLLFLVVTVIPITRWWSAALAGSFSNPPAGGAVLIVLGGSMQDDGTIGGSSYWRAVYAVRLWRKGPYQHVLISGGNYDGVPVSVAIRDYMVAQGVPAEAIMTETRSLSTRENALYAVPLLTEIPGEKVLLTSDYHIYRAQRAFSRAGVETTPFSFPDLYKLSSSWAGRWSAFLALCVETAKIGYYKARGWI
jgi:uncharacterized SAM-binding protein YcdF (DUF218 family)